VLLATDGVTAPSGPQTYGVIVAGSLSEPRNFTFTASGASGDRLVATLLLTDGTFTNGFASFPFTLGGQASRTFANATGITINDDTMATPYPSSIDVLNMGGQVTRVSVTISNLIHTWPDDIDLLLVGPTGERATFMSDAGGSIAVSNVVLTFSDTAGNVLPDNGPLLSRSYGPANYASALTTSDRFDPPAPQPGGANGSRPYTNAALSTFNGTSPNGTWTLFVMDDDTGNNGSISGWSLEIETQDPVTPAINMLVSASAAPSPVALGASFTCNITVSNRGPVDASNVALVELMPAGLSFVSANATSGTWGHRANAFTWNLPLLPKGGSATVTMVARPTVTGNIVSSASVGADQVDLHIADNTITMITTVVGPPGLNIVRQGETLRLSWPATGFVLQAADALAAGGWADVEFAPQVVGEQNVVTIDLGDSNKFFRLRSP
jgi:uncharacterized repeat protein (TIGR01451 family)